MMFRAQLSGMSSMWPFQYTMQSSYYNSYDRDEHNESTDPNSEDRYRNCEEWLSQCDKTVKIEDIYKIQYKTDGYLYVKSDEENKMAENFPDNTFVKFLLKPQNKDLYNYMLYAKQIEIMEIGGDSRFESWNYNSYYYNDEAKSPHSRNAQNAQERIKKVKSDFLKQRYAFQICRSSYYARNYETTITTYNQYFGKVNPKNLMSVWAVLFKAMATDVTGTKMEANRYYCQAFMYSNGKKFRSVQLFNPVDSVSDPFAEYTTQEISIAHTILAIKDPGRALKHISEAYQADKANPYIPFLVMREINKLEDWMITPLFYGKYSITNNDPFRCAYYDRWYEEYKTKYPDQNKEENDEDQKVNLDTDMHYLARVKSEITMLLSTSKGESRDFYCVSLAHLSLLQENAGDARKYLAMISKDANPTIQLQKNLENIWLAIKTQDVNSSSFKNVFLKNVSDLDKISVTGYNSNQMLYTLTLSLANEYLKKGNRVTGTLMRLKAEYYKSGRSPWWYTNQQDGYYYGLNYFDNIATIEDMDELITLMERKNKPEFEKYLCRQTLNSVDAYKDLKGTIAFRNNDLQLAYKTFASMPQDYWSKAGGIGYSSALNEDPFIPKGIGKDKDRRYDYAFNKTQFVKTLIDLTNRAEKEKDKTKQAEYYIKLGNAYYNTTYRGNAWMMVRYAWSIGDAYYSKTDCLPTWMQNYMTGNMAKKYYEKALAVTSDKEQLAFSNLMMYVISRDKYLLAEKEADNTSALNYNHAFKKYRNTNTFKKYDCPGIGYFLAAN